MLDFLDWTFFFPSLVSITFIFLFYILGDIFIFQTFDRFIFVLAVVFFLNILFLKKLQNYIRSFKK